jgi:hypothetical protein
MTTSNEARALLETVERLSRREQTQLVYLAEAWPRLGPRRRAEMLTRTLTLSRQLETPRQDRSPLDDPAAVEPFPATSSVPAKVASDRAELCQIAMQLEPEHLDAIVFFARKVILYQHMPAAVRAERMKRDHWYGDGEGA